MLFRSNEKDYAAAHQDLVTTGAMPIAPEAGGLEDLTSWDTPLRASGAEVPAREADDEANIAEKLVEEGIEEADHGAFFGERLRHRAHGVLRRRARAAAPAPHG